MNIERIQLKGQLAEAKSILLIRAVLNPFEEDTTKIEVEKAVVSINKLQDVVEELKGLKTKIQKLEEYFD